MTIKLIRPAAAHAVARLAKQAEVALAAQDNPDLHLSLPQYRLLAYLEGGAGRARQLANFLAVSPPTLTSLVDGLVAKGLVERVQDEGDRRGVIHVLTEYGEVALSFASSDVLERLSCLVEHLTADEARRAEEGLILWNTAMERAHTAATVKAKAKTERSNAEAGTK